MILGVFIYASLSVLKNAGIKPKVILTASLRHRLH